MTVRITPSTKPAADGRTVDEYPIRNVTVNDDGTLRVSWDKVHITGDGSRIVVGSAEATVDPPGETTAFLRGLSQRGQSQGAVPAGTISES